MPENLEQKGLTKVVKVCVKRTPDFESKRQMDVKREYYGVKTGQIGPEGCTPALAGLGRLFLV
jgi:hypothetical protein